MESSFYVKLKFVCILLPGSGRTWLKRSKFHKQFKLVFDPKYSINASLEIGTTNVCPQADIKIVAQFG